MDRAYDASVAIASAIRLWSIGVVLVSAFGCSGHAPPSAPDTLRAELRDLIEDVAGSTDHHYQLRDTDGRDMGPLDVLWSPEAGQFAAIYFTWEDQFDAFAVHLATSEDLSTWEHRRTYSIGGSQPSIARTSSGRYVTAWEQQPDPIHLELLEWPTWTDLIAERDRPRLLEPPISTPSCGEGTPDITTATDDRVDVTFHYHSGCERDRQAHGWTDWTAWSATADHDLDSAVEASGVRGHIGDRTSFIYRGHPFMVIEGETIPGDWSSWRLFLYDPSSGTLDPLHVRTHGGSRAFSNPSVEIVNIDGQQSLLVTMYLFTEGAAAGEDGVLLYHHAIPAALPETAQTR